MPKKQNPRSFGAASQLEMLELKLEGNSRSAALEFLNCDTNISNVFYNIYIYIYILPIYEKYIIIIVYTYIYLVAHFKYFLHVLSFLSDDLTSIFLHGIETSNQQIIVSYFRQPSPTALPQASGLFFHVFFGTFSHPQLLFPKCCHYSLPHNHPQSTISRGFIQQTGILDPEAIYWCELRLTSLRPSSASL